MGREKTPIPPKLQKVDIDYRLISADTKNPEAKELIQQYYELREFEFKRQYGQSIYNGADEFDTHPKTLFLLGTSKVDGEDVVVSGGRFIFHTPGSDDRLRFEADPNLQIENVLPHIKDTKQKLYAEIGGVVANRRPKFANMHLGTSLQTEAMKLIKNGDVKTDFTVALVNPVNVGPMVSACNLSNIPHAVLPEKAGELYGTKRVIMLFSKDKKFINDLMDEPSITTMPGNEFRASRAPQRTKTPVVSRAMP